MDGAAGVAAEAAALDRALLSAHAACDLRRLVALYAAAGERAAEAGDAQAAAFYRTHAYVFALEAGDPAASSLHALLVAAGCDE